MFQIDVVEQCKNNNRKGQLKLYRQYCDGMFCLAMRYVKNTDDAEDVLQESFLKAFQRIEQYEGNVTFGAWLKRIVINKCIDFLKSKKHETIEFEERHLPVTEDEDWSVDDGVTVKEIKAAMQELPEKYKYVVMMYLLEGYDHGEISQILSLTETTCRTRLLRGKGYLKQLLKEKNYGARY
ncbi:RNA polymerase sigma factor [Zobellia barbeyronii]|uniref:RNA polymerase sigma factor n=1 Tax=Zobellia barbeyronii TaxID=2748009 RepID=A0ABS5WJ48_9FLAO|nr:RNA polymerase sigma factor [Zobellia barbeyronii]MBT2163429.1 RNA polymerase sigma factor [Zobellia barbeyronii]